MVARWALACGFLASTTLALYTKSIVDFVRDFLPLTMSGLGVIILLGRFWRRSTWQGALAALLATPAVSLAFKFIPAAAPFRSSAIIPATLVGLAAHVMVSLLTPSPKQSFESVAEALSHERQAIEGALPEKAAGRPLLSDPHLQAK